MNFKLYLAMRLPEFRSFFGDMSPELDENSILILPEIKQLI